VKKIEKDNNSDVVSMNPFFTLSRKYHPEYLKIHTSSYLAQTNKTMNKKNGNPFSFMLAWIRGKILRRGEISDYIQTLNLCFIVKKHYYLLRLNLPSLSLN